jgi:hypothetical protein
MVVLSGFFGAWLTNFNNRDRVITKMIKIIKKIIISLFRWFRHHLRCLLCLMRYSLYICLLCILLCSAETSNLKKRTVVRDYFLFIYHSHMSYNRKDKSFYLIYQKHDYSIIFIQWIFHVNITANNNTWLIRPFEWHVLISMLVFYSVL